MQIIPKSKNTLRRSILLYRRVRYRKGFGVHSPFVYDLITKVIEESGSYYPLADIALLRQQLLDSEDIISYKKKKSDKIKKVSKGRLIHQYAISPKQGALLFKLTNYFKPRHILQIGTSMGLSTLYLTSYAAGIHCIALEETPEFALIAQSTFEKGARNPIDLRIGNYTESLPKALKDLERLDFVFFNIIDNQQSDSALFDECIKHIHTDSVFVIKGIRTSANMRYLWKEICAHPEVTVSIDLFSLGIVFFNKKLYKRNYITYY